MAEADPEKSKAPEGQFVEETTDELPLRPTGVVPFRTMTTAVAELERPAELPDRYEVRVADQRHVLLCREAPGVAVSIERHYAFSEVDARKLGERTILLDGAGAFAPLVDDSKHLYNLDHHTGCLRAFTLATCEQALIMVLKGLELDTGDWTVYANEPDLDTVLAIWVLLNHRRVRRLSPRARDAIVPLLRLEGSIDANGFEIAEHCGLSQDRVAKEKARVDELFQKELAAKKSGWSEADLAEYARGMLAQVDRMVYEAADFDDFEIVEQEYGHVSIGANKVAVVCRDSAGIYDVEKRLKKVWDDRLCLVALERAPNQYTLRLSAGLSGIALEDAYERLNLLDPAVDGRPPEKRWGGSDEIGGSPRPQGTGLTPREIGQILKLTYQRIRPLQRAQRVATTALWTLIVALAAGLGVWARRLLATVPSVELAAAADLAAAAVVAGLGAWVLTQRLSRGWTWLFGWRRPAQGRYPALSLLVLLGAAAGGIWVPLEISASAQPLAASAGAMLLAALALALWFPGLVHGHLVLEGRVQTVGGRWFVSRPALATGLLFAAVTVAAARYGVIAPAPPLLLEALRLAPPSFGPPLLAPFWGDLVQAVGAFVGGVGMAMMRERSLSLWPSAGALAAGCVVRLLMDAF